MAKQPSPLVTETSHDKAERRLAASSNGRPPGKPKDPVPSDPPMTTRSSISFVASHQPAPKSSPNFTGVATAQQSQPGDVALQPLKCQPAIRWRAQEAENDSSTSESTVRLADEPSAAAPFSNGYHFPPKHSVSETIRLNSLAFWHYFFTPVGFLVTIYGLNVVAWGGMLFLLLCNASPAMCYPTCDHSESPRRKWIEIDSQILNALFCITGFGLAPWRFRDLFYLLQYRLFRNLLALRRLAAIHRAWFRLPGSTELPIYLGPETVHDRPALNATQIDIPYPEYKIPDPPLTGVQSQPTKIWKLDTVIWLMVWNTILQCCLSGFMWGMDRFNRPSWATGLFVGLACAVAGVGGLVMFVEKNAVKSVEGVPVSPEDVERLKRDREHCIWHYNIKDKAPKATGLKVCQY